MLKVTSAIQSTMSLEPSAANKQDNSPVCTGRIDNFSLCATAVLIKVVPDPVSTRPRIDFPLIFAFR
jgi:hypothetical protein